MVEQLAQLRVLLSALRGANLFYSQKLAASGVTEAIGSIGEFQQRMPFTTKDELVVDQAAHPPFGSNLTYPVARYSRFCQTTGTSGRALTWLDTKESWGWMLDNWAAIFRAADVTAEDRIFFAFSFGPFLGFWTAFESAARIGCLCLPGGGQSSAARLRTILRQEATVLCCTPTYALHLMEVAAAERIDLNTSHVTRIIVAGEPGGSVDSVRARIAAGWNGARLIDHYGMTEIGPTAFEPAPGALQVLEQSYIAEVIDSQTGMETAAGETGELVITTLGRLGSPVLRYRTGDLVRRSAGKDRGALFEGGILGRVDDMVVVRGVNVYPSAVDAVVRGVTEIGEYQVEVARSGALREITLTAECSGEPARAQLEAALHHAFALRIPVRRVTQGSLPRFTMKARRWSVIE
jgi:phenylacetate-CoA ligase